MFAGSLIGVLGLAHMAAMVGSSRPLKLEVGQVWKYMTRPGEEGSRLTIDRIEVVREKYDVVHISIIGLPPSAPAAVLPHIPMGLEALQQSLTEMVGTMAKLPPWEAGYAAWKEAQGGWFTVSVADVIDLAEVAYKRPK